VYGGGGTPALRAEIDRRGLVRPSNWQSVDAGRIGIGMNECEAQISWWPLLPHRTITARGVSTQWVHTTGPASAQYVYTEGGVVTAVQE